MPVALWLLILCSNFFRRKPMVLLALAQTSLSHFKSSVMVTPRYLAEVTLESVCPCSA